MTTPRAERLHLTLFGPRNAGKSSLINAIAGRTVAIVSPQAGTTTDPVVIPMELGALGAVAVCDTAGLDDSGSLGEQRVARSLERLSWTDLAILVTPAHRPPAPAETAAWHGLATANKPRLVVVTHADQGLHLAKARWLAELGTDAAPLCLDCRAQGAGQALRDRLITLAASGQLAAVVEASPLDGLVAAGDVVLLVTPIDTAAPKGRLILPQAETLRDALDRGCIALVTRETELPAALASLARPPRLVVTDSQAFAVVAAALPPEQPLTSFSILFARKKGELTAFGPALAWLDSQAVDQLADQAGASAPPLRLLAIEACTHNRTHEDIATVKIPRLLAARTGRAVQLTVARELRDVPTDAAYDLAVICGGCMATRGRMLAQLDSLAAAGVPVVNFGLFLAWAHGVFPRAVEPLTVAPVMSAPPAAVNLHGDKS